MPGFRCAGLDGRAELLDGSLLDTWNNSLDDFLEQR